MAMLLRLRHELDACHVCAVTLAEAGLEDARVAAVTGGKARSDLLEQLVGRFALLDVTNGETTGMQGASACLRDELLDERTKLLGLGLGRLDRLALDERRREVA